MRVARTLPPTAVPIGWKNLLSGIIAVFKKEAELDRYSAELTEYFDEPYCFLVSSGKAALTLILLALKEIHPDRNEVIIPAYTCYSVPSAIVRAGLKIKLCDICTDSFDFNFENLGTMLKSEKLLCVIPTHLFGLPADVKRLQEMIGDTSVTVVEDAAQAMGAEWQGQKLGSLGDVVFFSTGRGKAFSTIEGGIILTKNDALAERMKKLIADLPRYPPLEIIKLMLYTVALNLLMYPNMFWLPKSLPFLKLGETFFDPDFKIRKMSSFQAGLATEWSIRLASFQQVRAAYVNHWQTIFPQASLRKLNTKNLPLLRFPITLKDQATRLDLLQKGEANGLGIAISYPEAIHRIPKLKRLFSGQHYPVAVDIAQRLLTLPVHGYLSDKDRSNISKLLMVEEIKCES